MSRKQYFEVGIYIFKQCGPELGQKSEKSRQSAKERLRIEILFFKMASSPVTQTKKNRHFLDESVDFSKYKVYYDGLDKAKENYTER